MATDYKSLVLNVHHADQARQFIIRKGERFTIGRRGDNDLILYGPHYPKRHTLISQKNGAFLLNIQSYVDGEISTERSKLLIKDLVHHDVLPRRGDAYVIKLTPNKQGVLTVGDEITIEFLFKAVKAPQPALPVAHPDTFSWSRATLKNLTQDLQFKSIFLFLFSIYVFILYAFKGYVPPAKSKVDIARVPERLAKFIPKPLEAILEIDNKSLSGLSENAESGNDKNKNGKQSSNNKTGNRKGNGEKRGNPAATAGLLGLLAGTGSSGKTSSIVDALVDRGLVADLNSIVGGGTHLKVAPGGGKGDADPLDQLIGTGGSGGIDDFLSAMEENAPQVTLTKKAKVDLIKPSKMTGSTEALGRRNEQSIMQVVLGRQGQITYLYEKYLKKNPNLRGKISIEFTIAANGFITEAKIIESTINLPELEQEILNLIKRLKFEPIPSGNVTTIFPFQFSKLNS